MKGNINHAKTRKVGAIILLLANLRKQRKSGYEKQSGYEYELSSREYGIVISIYVVCDFL